MWTRDPLLKIFQSKRLIIIKLFEGCHLKSLFYNCNLLLLIPLTNLFQKVREIGNLFVVVDSDSECYGDCCTKAGG